MEQKGLREGAGGEGAGRSEGTCGGGAQRWELGGGRWGGLSAGRVELSGVGEPGGLG